MISDLDLMIHVINNLTPAYETLIQSFERYIGLVTSKFTIEHIKDELRSKYDRMKTGKRFVTDTSRSDTVLMYQQKRQKMETTKLM